MVNLSACWPRQALCMYFMPQSFFHCSAAASFLRQSAAGKVFFPFRQSAEKSFLLLSFAKKRERIFSPCTVASLSLLPGEKGAGGGGEEEDLVSLKAICSLR